MEVFLAVLVVAFIGYALYNNQSNQALKDENNTLAELISKSIIDSENDLADHRAAELELKIVNAKLETIKETTLTPENSIPKAVYQSKVFEMSQSISSTQADLQNMTHKFEESRGKQISERVRLGQIGENFSCFHSQFPYDRKQVKALFQPIDLIYFGEDEIVFIDVKTGNAKLSTKQRRIRDNIQAGRVRFEVHTLNEDGYKIK